MKVWCIPLDKHLGTFQWKCQEKEQGPVMMSNQFLMAQQAVIEECGLLDITVKVRSARRLFMSTEKKRACLAESLLIHTLLPGVDRAGQRSGAGYWTAHLVVRVVDAEGRGHLHQPAFLHHTQEICGGHNHGPAAGVMGKAACENAMGTAQTTHTSSQIKPCSVQTKLNKTRVIRAAMHDLLTSQCDRHAQNVFVNEHGQIRLIDNLQVWACEGA